MLVDFLLAPFVLAAVSALPSVPTCSLKTVPAMRGMVSAQSQNSRITYLSSAMTSQPSSRPAQFLRHRLQRGVAGDDQFLVRNLLAACRSAIPSRPRFLSVAAAIICWVWMLLAGSVLAVGQVAAALRDDLMEQALGDRHMHHAGQLCRRRRTARRSSRCRDRRRSSRCSREPTARAATRSAVPV